MSALLAAIVARASATSSAAPTRTKSFCMSTTRSTGLATRSRGSIMAKLLGRNGACMLADRRARRLGSDPRPRRVQWCDRTAPGEAATQCSVRADEAGDAIARVAPRRRVAADVHALPGMDAVRHVPAQAHRRVRIEAVPCAGVDDD